MQWGIWVSAELLKYNIEMIVVIETHAGIEVREGELPTRGLQSVGGEDIKSCHYLISVHLYVMKEILPNIYIVL